MAATNCSGPPAKERNSTVKPTHTASPLFAWARRSALLALAAPLWAAAQMTPLGLWKSLDDETGRALAEIRIRANDKGELVGAVERSLYSPPGEDLLCSLCEDDRKGKPKLGMEIIRGARQDGSALEWVGGEILDPNKGKTYRLKLTPLEGGKKLQVRGYVGVFYRTQVWERVQ